MQQLLTDPAIRGAAIRGLAQYDDPLTPEKILAVIATLPTSEKKDAINTLAARPIYARQLLDAVAKKQIATSDISAEVVRQLANLNDEQINTLLKEQWGSVRKTGAEKAKMILDYRKLITAPAKASDLALGRAMFAKTCQQCHTLYGVGGKVGPDITGANRANLDYLLENILDPDAVIPKEYSVSIFRTTGGQTITGILKNENPTSLTIQTATETVVVPKDEIESRKASELSMMPDDLLKPLKEIEIRALIAYLQSPKQTLLLGTLENAKDLFNGKDLTGWDGDPALWKVEGGEIVGKSPGIKRNEFLRSQMLLGDFRLRLKVKLTPNRENSGVQFRSEALPNGEVRGYQADVGAGWWGKLYEENGRGILFDKSGDEHVKVDDWNDYEVVAIGSKLRTFLNGKPCVDIDDLKGAKQGILAFQIHSGGPMEVRFKEIKLELK